VGVLDGKVAIVTAGGGSGMGQAISKAFAREGAAVAVADIDERRATRVADEIAAAGGSALAVAVDVADAAQVQRLIDQVVERYGWVGILAHHAGVIPNGKIEDITEEAWDRAIAVHLKGAFLCARAVVPHMKSAGWGRIISTSSRAGYRPMAQTPGCTDYAAAKAALGGFSRALAIELGPFGITVNTIAPGAVAGGDMRGDAGPDLEDYDRTFSIAEGQVLPPRLITPEEIAESFIYLSSPAADRITGTVLHVNGGSYFPA
jgi:3-oxoacyl-[acyl-carrier protein] reductase